MPPKKRFIAFTFGIVFYILVIVIISQIIYFSNDTPLWREGTWFLAFLELMLYITVLLTVPILLLAIALGIWYPEREKSDDIHILPPPRPTEPQPTPEPERPASSRGTHGIDCPNCGRWLPPYYYRCPECELPVANMGKLRDVQTRLRAKAITREQYESTVKALMDILDE
ncbi:MAG: hypothetical protein PHU53_00500 [Thermoplasmata archaeon]|nr:hypothetical protein [Thermoplasmata archaeon]